MAKISPVSIKYMIHANFVAEGALEKPDVIGAVFGQTEGLLGNDLDMRELQKEGKIGRIEVSLERNGKQTTGVIQIPTAIDQSETTLIAAAIETIDRIGPSDAQINVEKIEDVRGNKRDYIIERAKKLMEDFQGTSSREISNEIKVSSRTSSIQSHGKNKLPCGDLSGDEIIVVEGRADVVNMLRHNMNNVIGMQGTKLPDEIKELGESKTLILFVDGDRGGKLIARNVVDNAKVSKIAVAPEGKEVEELEGKEILMALRKTVSPDEFLSQPDRRSRGNFSKPRSSSSYSSRYSGNSSTSSTEKAEALEITDDVKKKLKEIAKSNDGSEKAILLDSKLEEIKAVSAKTLAGALRRISKKPSALVIDGTVTGGTLSAAEDAGCKVIIAKNFASAETSIELLSM